MKQVTQIVLKESVNVDKTRLGALYAQLGEASAEDVVCRAMEELALRLDNSSQLYQNAASPELRKCVKSLGAIADQIGMSAVSSVAGHVVNCVDRNDPIALAATMGRLLRIGEESLTAIWNLQGLKT